MGKEDELIKKALKEKEELEKVHAKLKLKAQERASELKKSNNSLKKEIEEYKKVEEKANILANIVESSDAIISLALDGTITSWNWFIH